MARLVISNGSIEFLKWIALVTMTGDHINKYLFNGTILWLFDLGRLAMPLFTLVLAYHLAQPAALQSGIHKRIIKRLAIFGLVATPAFIYLNENSLLYGWLPLNIIFTLLVSTSIVYFVGIGGRRNICVAFVIFIIAGSAVEFSWPAIAIGVTAWWYFKNVDKISFLLLMGAFLALCVINENFLALLSLPLFVFSSRIDVRMPRLRWVFYTYYPLHLTILWLIRVPMRRAGYLFFT